MTSWNYYDKLINRKTTYDMEQEDFIQKCIAMFKDDCSLFSIRTECLNYSIKEYGGTLMIDAIIRQAMELYAEVRLRIYKQNL